MVKSLLFFLTKFLIEFQVQGWRALHSLKRAFSLKKSDKSVSGAAEKVGSRILVTALILQNKNEPRLSISGFWKNRLRPKQSVNNLFVPQLETWRLRSKKGPRIRWMSCILDADLVRDLAQSLGAQQLHFAELGKHREAVEMWNGKMTIIFLSLKVTTLPWTSNTVRQETEKLLMEGDPRLGAEIFAEIQSIPLSTRLILLRDPDFHALAAHATLVTREQVQLKFSQIGSSWKILKVARPKWLPSGSFLGQPSFEKRSFTKSFRRYLELSQETQVFSGGTVVSNGDLVETDYAQSHFFNFVAGRWDHVIGNSFNLDYAAVNVPEAGEAKIKVGILLGSRADFNWFHWVIETVPRLLLVENLPTKVPVLVTDRVSQEGIALLEMITSREIRRIDSTIAQSVENLFVPGQVIFHPDSQEFASGNSSFLADEEVLQVFRRMVINRINPSTRPFDRSIFITRRSGARVPFAVGLVEITYRMLGFKVLDLAKLTLVEQLEAVANANRIVLLGGAGMTNLLFCNPEAKVVCFYPKAVGNFSVQERLARLAGARLITLKGLDISFLFRLPHAKHHVRYLISPIMVARSMLFFRRGH